MKSKDDTKRPAGARDGRDAARRAQFARDVARAELGRFYWSESQAAEMRRATGVKAKPAGAGRGKERR